MDQAYPGRKKSSRVQMGPGAASLILIFVMLALSILAMLTLINARNDERVSARSARVTEEIYALEARTQLVYAQVLEACAQPELEDALQSGGPGEAVAAYVNEHAEEMPERLTGEGDTVSWTSEDDERSFDCALRLTGDPERPVQWVRHQMTTQIALMEEEWNF